MLIQAFMTVFLGNSVIKNPGFYIIMTGSAFIYSRQTVTNFRFVFFFFFFFFFFLLFFFVFFFFFWGGGVDPSSLGSFTALP